MKISISHVLLFLGASFCMTCGSILPAQISNSSYYIDALNGNDNNVGSQSDPWQTLDNISGNYFLPGDSIYFKRGTSHSGSVTINGDGTADEPITISAYGNGDAPRFTNPD